MNKRQRSEKTYFSKYAEKGAYHWNAYYRDWQKANPMIRARYDIVSDLLTRHFAKREGVGVDVGCGDGLLLHLLRKRFSHVIGLDLEPDGLRVAREQLAKHHQVGITLLHGSGYALPLDDQSVDYVVALELIEHLEHPEQLMQEAQRTLKPGGLFICTTPRRNSTDYHNVTDEYHIHEFTGQELTDLIGQYFGQVTVKGFEPPWLERLYLGRSGINLLDKGIRFGMRLIATLHNPYRYAFSLDADKNAVNQLIGIGITGK